jgi:hypothetical protein
MPRRIVAEPREGLPGKWEEKNGSRSKGAYRIAAVVYGPGEAVDAGDRTTLPELRAKYWNPERRSLVIPFNGGTYEFGSELLRQAGDTSVIQIRKEFWYSKPPRVETCICGKLSFPHAVQYHGNNTRGE